MTLQIGATQIYNGDCCEYLATFAALGMQFDSCVTDPPYHLTSIVKRFGKDNAAPAQFGTDGAFARASRGFMGKEWDGGDVAFRAETWRLVFDVLKPGAHLVAFSGSRTYHRMVCAIEDAGFEIRDQIMWIYGTGFPKSHNVSKAIDAAAGATREVIAKNPNDRKARSNNLSEFGLQGGVGKGVITAPATDAAREWSGWGTALKPAHEPIVLARKPLIGTVAENILAHGTGAINIDASRVVGADNPVAWDTPRGGIWTTDPNATGVLIENTKGRFPANVIHDGSDEVLEAFPGTAARFFYSAKASKADRAGSKHPTIKPVDLIRYLATMVTPADGVCLDPFAGSGTLGAAWPRSVLIEREPEYFIDICQRLAR